MMSSCLQAFFPPFLALIASTVPVMQGWAFGWYERGAASVTGAAQGSSHGRKREGQLVHTISKVFFVLKHTLWFTDGAHPPQQ